MGFGQDPYNARASFVHKISVPDSIHLKKPQSLLKEMYFVLVSSPLLFPSIWFYILKSFYGCIFIWQGRGLLSKPPPLPL